MILSRSRKRFLERIRGPAVARKPWARPAVAGPDTSTDPIIQVEHLWKSFDSNVILEDISLRIMPGDELALVGGSGCGKTVLAKHFNGLLEPDKGRVIVRDIDLTQATYEQLEEVRRQIGYVFQGNALFASSLGDDVYANVSLPLRDNPYDFPARNEDEIREKVATALESVGLGREYFDRHPSQLSGGQKKRVAVARAVVSNPDTIIYDEPTTGLDPESTGTVIDLIETLYKATRNTTIVITHEKRLMERLRRVIFLKDRKAYFDGTFVEFSHCDDPAVVRFLSGSASPSAPPAQQVP